MTVLDQSAPVPDVATLGTVTGECSATISSAPTATDNCAGSITGTTSDPLIYNARGTHTVTWTYDDGNGNTTTQTQDVVVDDRTNPTVLTQDITVYLDGSGNASITAMQIDDGSSDACGIAEMSVAPSSFDCSDVGMNIVTLTVTDNNDNSATGTATVTVLDNEFPTMTAPSAVTVNTDPGSCSASGVVLGTPVVSDNCGTSVTNNAPTSFPLGQTTVTWTVTDPSGNSAAATQLVSVEDHTNPTVLTQDITVYLDGSGNVSITATQIDDGSSDACGIAEMLVAPSSFDCSDVGTNTVALTVTDNHDNSGTAKATVTVLDNEFPTMIALSAVTVNTDPGSCSASGVALGTPVVSDNCGTWVTNNAPASFPLGTTVVTWTVTDPSRNSAATTQLVSVEDHTNPTVLTQDITVYLDGSGNASITAMQIDDGSSDVCGIAEMSVAPSRFDCSDVGTNIVTLTVTDNSDNSATGTATVTVLDNEFPTITAPSAVTVNTDPGSCSASGVALGTPVVSDNCGTSVTNNAPTSFPLGTTVVTWTVTDPTANSATVTQTVTVEKVVTIADVTVTPSAEQYSDEVTFTATISPGSCANAGIAASSVTFYVGTQSMGTVPLSVSGGILTGTLTTQLLEPVPFGDPPTGQMEPGTQTVKAVFSSVDPDFIVTDPTTTLTIEEEDAEAIYTGVPFVSTPSVSSKTATIPLAASIVDFDDGDRGEIRNSRVTFRMDDPVSGTVIGSSNLQPVLVSPSNTAVGTVASSGSYTLTGAEVNKKGTSFVVYTVIDNYYQNILISGQPDYDTQVITVSMPGSEAVTGGGFLVMQNSAGYWTGTTGKKMNFGLTMKYNPSGKNLQGQANIIFRANDSIYQIKSNAINTMAVNSVTSEAYFNTKANLQNVTDPQNVISLGGNLDLTVSMRDVSTGGANDEISIHLARQNGQVLFSSHWSNNQTVRRQLNPPFGNGNIRVRSSSIPRTAPGLETGTPSGFALSQNYPNPFNPATTISYTLMKPMAVALVISDALGREVKRVVSGKPLAVGTHSIEFDASGLSPGVYFYRLETPDVVLVRKMVLMR